MGIKNNPRLLEGYFVDQLSLLVGCAFAVCASCTGCSAGALLSAVSGVVTLQAVWILRLPLVDCFSNLTISAEVFPEANLVAVNDHAISWTVQFTPKLYK